MTSHDAAKPAAPATSGGATWLARLTRWRVGIGAFVILGALLALPSIYDMQYGFSAGFQLHRLSLIGIFIIAALAQNILTGYAAQPSLGNAAFFGVGAYMLAWTTTDLHYSYLVGIVVAMAVSIVLGVIVGGPALRVSGAYLAIATLGLVFVTHALLDLWDQTNSRQNYELSALPDTLLDDHNLFYFLLAIMAVVVFFAYFLLRSRVGRAWVAIRDNESAAEAFGVNLTRYKLLAFVVSSTLTGLAGALYATWATTASATSSSSNQTIAFLAMIVVGGLGSIVGSVLGAIFVGFLPIWLNQLPNVVNLGPVQVQISTLNSGIYGLLLLLALIYFPNGLRSLIDRVGELGQRILRRGGQS